METSEAPPIFRAVADGDADAIARLLEDGANPRERYRGETALHAAVRRGEAALVEALIAGGALEWQTDDAGRTALAVALDGQARDRAAIVALLDRREIADPSFRAAVAAIHAGDVQGLERLLDAEPRLLRERLLGPEAYRLARRRQYFLDPKLFWFVANNPTLVQRMPENIVEIAQTMIARGVDRADLDYTLALVTTSSVAREQGHQRPLIALLLAAGAKPDAETIASTAAHYELDALRALLEAGIPMTAPIAAALGDEEALRDLIRTANRDEIATAFGLAAINGHAGALRIALEAGADPNAFVPIHTHATALHQVALLDRADLVELLVACGARTDIRDALWDGTPLDWAIHERKTIARSALEAAS
jgi:ankyrin repeat protein